MNKIQLMSITLFVPKIKFLVFNILLDHVAYITEMYILLVLQVFITCFSSLHMQKSEDWPISSIISSYLEYVPIQNLINSSLLSNNNNNK